MDLCSSKVCCSRVQCIFFLPTSHTASKTATTTTPLNIPSVLCIVLESEASKVDKIDTTSSVLGGSFQSGYTDTKKIGKIYT